MIYVDKFAYTNKISQINPMEKFSFSISSIAISTYFNTNTLYAAVIFTNLLLLTLWARIPAFFLFRMFLIPLYFLTASIFTLVTKWGPDIANEHYLINLLWFGISHEGLETALSVFLKAFSGISCLYFLSLTIPLGDMVRFFNKIRIPAIVLELILLTYRFIFLFAENVGKIRQAQISRLGNRTFKSRLQSISSLASTILIISLKKYQDSYRGLQSRGFNGSFKYVSNERPFSLSILFLILTVNIFYILIGLGTTR